MVTETKEPPLQHTCPHGKKPGRRWNNIIFQAVAITALVATVSVLILLLVDISIDGIPRLNWTFLSHYPSRKPEMAGILSALVGSGCLVFLTGLIAFPIGVGAAIYLEEYAGNNWFSKIIEVNIANLAGVPSIIYGLLGLEVFVRIMHMDRSLLAGACTLALLVLPMIIIASREAMRTVPVSIREASFAVGATRWETIRYHVLPLAFPGILTGTILALSRAIGEAAPLIPIGALTYVAFLPDSPLAPFTALPIQIFNWISRPQKGFADNAAAGSIVLLVVLLLMNAGAIWLRNRYQKKLH
ncbi:MAG: phosphate ABC transporter, permease protein PstA [Planctomycetes bacterium GWA2_50_13]|nr:MAG: phosphate ABC transporter, permease protein PstA [Planctomycetes bacterium GWA2_50_13]OHB95927.1 MAG: phosphate ABC transporter, permease protein PstA [Planctomycetes bacterium RIFCSPLOWO2_02_FULL_50_16]OHC02465.1 MAG: phosphate ABC transporter, permease protein PstA [Planctomycetes bacterium RIFCSPLOWO2_12_FULL_50_35]HCN18882.1 phosphate ABC transporter permease PtsA [Planctomycetia bacterium]